MPPRGTEIPLVSYLLHRLSDILLSIRCRFCPAWDSRRTVDSEGTAGFRLEYVDNAWGMWSQEIVDEPHATNWTPRLIGATTWQRMDGAEQWPAENAVWLQTPIYSEHSPRSRVVQTTMEVQQKCPRSKRVGTSWPVLARLLGLELAVYQPCGMASLASLLMWVSA